MFGIALVVTWSGTRAAADPPDGPPVGLAASDGRALIPRSTATVAAGLAVVDLTQTFHNPYDEALDRTYVLPLPEGAAVRHVALRCDDRRLVATVDTVQAARQTYGAAADAGPDRGAADRPVPPADLGSAI